MRKIHIVEKLWRGCGNHLRQQSAAADGSGGDIGPVIDDDLATFAENVLNAILPGRKVAIGNLDIGAMGVGAVHRADKVFHQLVRILEGWNRLKQIKDTRDALVSGNIDSRHGALSASCDVILAPGEDKSRYFRRAAKSHRHAAADATRDIKPGAAHVKEAFVKLLEVHRQDHRAEDGDADLPAVRVAGQDPVCPKAAKGENLVGVVG